MSFTIKQQVGKPFHCCPSLLHHQTLSMAPNVTGMLNIAGRFARNRRGASRMMHCFLAGFHDHSRALAIRSCFEASSSHVHTNWVNTHVGCFFPPPLRGSDSSSQSPRDLLPSPSCMAHGTPFHPQRREETPSKGLPGAPSPAHGGSLGGAPGPGLACGVVIGEGCRRTKERGGRRWPRWWRNGREWGSGRRVPGGTVLTVRENGRGWGRDPLEASRRFGAARHKARGAAATCS